jgi:signal transduction histidine kinase
MSESSAPIQAERDALFRRLHPLLPGGDGCEQVSAAARERLLAAWNPQPSANAHCPASQRVAEDLFGRTDAGRRERAALELQLMRRAEQSRQLEAHAAPFGMVKAFAPVVARGRIVHGLWTGPLKLNPFSDGELQTLKRITGLDLDYIRRRTAEVPIHTQEQIDRILDLHRELARALGALVEGERPAMPPPPAHAPAASPAGAGLLANAASGVAHHLNNLLSVILGYASHVANAEDQLSDASAAALAKINESALRARRVVRELLLFAGSTEEQPVVCGVHEALEGVLALLEPNLRRGVRVQRRFQAEKDQVLAPPCALHQMAFDMLTLALDSLPPHGGEVGVKTKITRLPGEAPGQPELEFLRVEVADSAGLRTLPGIDPLALEMLNLDQRVEEEQASLLYNLVRRLEGTVMVSSDPQGVTKVEILLPLAAEGGAAAHRAVKPRGATSRIWVVDDDPTFRDMCVQILRHDGHQVTAFAEGAVFQQAWKAGPVRPDLLVYDYSLPDLGGAELRDWLEAEQARLPVILVSGLDLGSPDARRVARMRKTYFLQKPFSQRELSDLASVAMGETLVSA